MLARWSNSLSGRAFQFATGDESAGAAISLTICCRRGDFISRPTKLPQ